VAGAAAVTAASTDRDAFKYLGFEDKFRGSREEIRSRLQDYLPLFAGASDVLDVGCGRGELLELFREAGITARGIDTNERMVSVCVERGLRAEQADALTYLRAQPDRSLGGLLAIQVVEHLSPDYLMAFLEAAYHALRPGSTLVLETINVACWSAFFETYMRDLTHVRPLHAETLKFVVEASGFTRADISYRSPVLDADRLPRVDAPVVADPSWRALADALNAHADKLNARMFSSMDYAVIARR
jgi:O-antigen chain-terminating methyltransferase